MQKKNSTYSDIYTFANAVTRVEKFLRREKRLSKRYYEPTRMLYLKLAQKLEECAKLAYQLAGRHLFAENVSQNCKPVEKISTPVPEVISEPAFELLLSSAGSTDSSSQVAPAVDTLSEERKAAKKIVSNYLKACRPLVTGQKFSECEASAKCASLLSMWLQLRFSKKSAVFRYRPENIKIWIDRFIYAYGYHWKNHLTAKFELDLQDWFTTLRKEDCKYPLPAFIFNMEDEDDPDMYCAETIVLERMIKIVIYSDQFYEDQLHSIEKKVLLKCPEYIGLSLNELISRCSDI